MSELGIIGGRGSHEVLREVLKSRTPGKVLDAPAGTGTMSHYMRDLGFDVHVADIDPGNFRAEGFEFTQVNLNRPLPFEDESFDAVVCANGLHRLFNPGGAILEFHRILKPGKSLHITLYNFASIAKRFRFLFYGSIKQSINECRYLQTTDDPEANVRHHLFFPQLSLLLEGAGFRIVKIERDALRANHRLLAPLAWFVRLASLAISRKSRRRGRLKETNSTAICPGGKYLYIEAVKAGGDGE